MLHLLITHPITVITTQRNGLNELFALPSRQTSVKVRGFQGAATADMYGNITAVLYRNPE